MFNVWFVYYFKYYNFYELDFAYKLRISSNELWDYDFIGFSLMHIIINHKHDVKKSEKINRKFNNKLSEERA